MARIQAPTALDQPVGVLLETAAANDAFEVVEEGGGVKKLVLDKVVPVQGRALVDQTSDQEATAVGVLLLTETVPCQFQDVKATHVWSDRFAQVRAEPFEQDALVSPVLGSLSLMSL